MARVVLSGLLGGAIFSIAHDMFSVAISGAMGISFISSVIGITDEISSKSGGDAIVKILEDKLK